MSKKNYFCLSIMKKHLIAISGILLSLFVLTHMAGNLLIFSGGEVYNNYSHALVSNPFILVAQIGLVVLFAMHVINALLMTIQNKKAKGGGYAVTSYGEKGTSFVTKTMWHQGIVIFVFVVWHLYTIKFGQEYFVDYGQGEIRDIFRLVIESFSSPLYTFGYIVSCLVLGYHLSHGLSSAIRTLGFNHSRYDCGVRIIGKAYAGVVAIGFIAPLIFIFFNN